MVSFYSEYAEQRFYKVVNGTGTVLVAKSIEEALGALGAK